MWNRRIYKTLEVWETRMGKHSVHGWIRSKACKVRLLSFLLENQRRIKETACIFSHLRNFPLAVMYFLTNIISIHDLSNKPRGIIKKLMGNLHIMRTFEEMSMNNIKSCHIKNKISYIGKKYITGCPWVIYSNQNKTKSIFKNTEAKKNHDKFCKSGLKHTTF